MKRISTLMIILLLLLTGPAIWAEEDGPEPVVVDFTMAEKTLDWLEQVKRNGDDDPKLRSSFFTRVVPTPGCQAIIHHWERFMEWDNEAFYRFVMTALGKIESNKPEKDETGRLTPFGKRKKLWQYALHNTDSLRRDIQRLKRMGLKGRAVALAKKYLPAGSPLRVNFYVVLFGASNAFAVGSENGFDLLQLDKKSDGSIDTRSVLELFAHEMHHSGYNSYYKKVTAGMADRDRLFLVSLLAAEGMPTHFINRTDERVRTRTLAENLQSRELVRIWEAYQRNMPRLFEKAGEDMIQGLRGELPAKELFPYWMGGLKGPAYALGAKMFSIIEEGLGLDAALQVAEDFRKFLLIYNQAARKLNQQGNTFYLFDEGLAEQVAGFGPAER